MSKYTKAFTLVFKGDIRNFKMNPLNTETPWGVLSDEMEMADVPTHA